MIRRPIPQSRRIPHVCALCGLPTTPDFEYQTDAGAWVHPSCFAVVLGGGTVTLGRRPVATCGNPLCMNPGHLEVKG